MATRRHLPIIITLMIMRFLVEKTGILMNHFITTFPLPAIITTNKTQEALQVKIFKGNLLFCYNIFLYVHIRTIILLKRKPKLLIYFSICRSSLTNQSEAPGSYLLSGKSASIVGGNLESSIRPVTSTESLHGSGGLPGSTSSPSLLSSSSNQIGIGSSGLLNESTSALEGTIIQIF